MKHNLETLKYKMERFPESIIPYDYLVQMIAELRKLNTEGHKLDSDFIIWHDEVYVNRKEILGEVDNGS